MKSKEEIMTLPSHQRKREFRKRKKIMKAESKIRGKEKEKERRSKKDTGGRI